MSTMTIARRAQIDDEFEGFDQDAIFALTDGTYWIQSEYRYWYHYAYRPQVEIVNHGGCLYLQLVGSNERVAVRQLHQVIESRIDGDFEGWTGNSVYTLTNGHTYRQRDGKCRSRHRHRPGVLVYDGGWKGHGSRWNKGARESRLTTDRTEAF